MTIKPVVKVSATRFRSGFKTYARKAQGNRVVLIENRQQGSKYLVDKIWFDDAVHDREAIEATLEVLADKELTDRLLKLARTVDRDVRAGKLHSMKEVFGKA